MTARGTFRIYFNRHQSAPLVWFVALMSAGSEADPIPLWELAVAGVGFAGIRVETVYRPKEQIDEDDGVPSAWLEAVGDLSVLEDGYALIGPSGNALIGPSGSGE